MRYQIRARWLRAGCLLSTVLLGGCPSTNLTQATKVQAQDQAGAVLLSVQDVVPWDRISDAMTPNFALTGDQALAKVIPATEQITQQVLQAFGATLAVGLPSSTTQSSTGSSLQSTSTTTTAAGSAPSTTGTTTLSNNASTTNAVAPGTIPQVPSGSPAGVQSLTAPQPPSGLGVDPLLQYQAALSLFESVQMMNREVQNVARGTCTIPYLVRLKLAFMPYRPNLGYTLHSHIGIFLDSNGTRPILPNVRTLIRSPPLTKGPSCRSSTPIVVPLLATDDIERTIRTRAVEVARQIGLALQVMIHNVGADASLNDLSQNLQAISGQDFNSRLTVSRITNNTLYVRIGGTNQAGAGQALVGQTYDIAALVLVPWGKPQVVDIISHTQFRDADNGALLPARSNRTFEKQFDAVVTDVLVGYQYQGQRDDWDRVPASIKDQVARLVSDLTTTGDFTSFRLLLHDEPPKNRGYAATFCPPLNPKQAESPNASMTGLSYCPVFNKFYTMFHTAPKDALWLRASELRADSLFQSTAVELPSEASLRVPPQAAILTDDGQAKAQVQLQNVDAWAGVHLDAVVNLTLAGSSYALAAQTSYDPTTRILTLSLPSLAKQGLTPTAATVSLTQVCHPDERCAKPDIPASIKVLVGKPTKTNNPASPGIAVGPKPNLTLTQPSKQIVENKGKGSVVVVINKLTDDYATVIVGGASVLSAVDGTNTAQPIVNNGIKVVKGVSTNIVFHLDGLIPGQTVTVTATGNKVGPTTNQSTTTGNIALSFSVIGG